MNKCGVLVIALLGSFCWQSTGQTPAKPSTQWMEIVLERKEATGWRTVDPNLVLKTDDVVRFKFQANFDGYLYVTDYGSSGSRSLLFPREETGINNKVSAGRNYVIPANGATFKVAGPAGFDSVYWLVSPVALTMPVSVGETNPTPPKPARLTPRCDPAQLRARSLCLDTDAGPHNVENTKTLPAEFSAVPRLRSRELTILQAKEKTRLSTTGGLNGPVIYEFRLAHN